jgi:serine/threonine protein kinase
MIGGGADSVTPQVRYLGLESVGPTRGSPLPAVRIYMDFATAGNAAHIVKRFGAFPEMAVRSLARQLVTALAYLHERGIAHRDIKGANVLLSHQGVLKLADLGSCKILKRTEPAPAPSEEREEPVHIDPSHIDDDVLPSLSTRDEHISLPPDDPHRPASPVQQGTVQWMAPEVVSGTVTTSDWFAADVWSVGCTIVEFATGKPLWDDADNAAAIMMAIASRDAIKLARKKLRGRMSAQGIDFVASCLQATPSARPSARQLLEDPFISAAQVPAVLLTHSDYATAGSPSQSVVSREQLGSFPPLVGGTAVRSQLVKSLGAPGRRLDPRFRLAMHLWAQHPDLQTEPVPAPARGYWLAKWYRELRRRELHSLARFIGTPSYLRQSSGDTDGVASSLLAPPGQQEAPLNRSEALMAARALVRLLQQAVSSLYLLSWQVRDMWPHWLTSSEAFRAALGKATNSGFGAKQLGLNNQPPATAALGVATFHSRRESLSRGSNSSSPDSSRPPRQASDAPDSPFKRLQGDAGWTWEASTDDTPSEKRDAVSAEDMFGVEGGGFSRRLLATATGPSALLSGAPSDAVVSATRLASWLVGCDVQSGDAGRGLADPSLAIHTIPATHSRKEVTTEKPEPMCAVAGGEVLGLHNHKRMAGPQLPKWILGHTSDAPLPPERYQSMELDPVEEGADASQPLACHWLSLHSARDMAQAASWPHAGVLHSLLAACHSADAAREAASEIAALKAQGKSDVVTSQAVTQSAILAGLGLLQAAQGVLSPLVEQYSHSSVPLSRCWGDAAMGFQAVDDEGPKQGSALTPSLKQAGVALMWLERARASLEAKRQAAQVAAFHADGKLSSATARVSLDAIVQTLPPPSPLAHGCLNDDGRRVLATACLRNGSWASLPVAIPDDATSWAVVTATAQSNPGLHSLIMSLYPMNGYPLVWVLSRHLERLMAASEQLLAIVRVLLTCLKASSAPAIRRAAKRCDLGPSAALLVWSDSVLQGMVTALVPAAIEACSWARNLRTGLFGVAPPLMELPDGGKAPFDATKSVWLVEALRNGSAGLVHAMLRRGGEESAAPSPEREPSTQNDAPFDEDVVGEDWETQDELLSRPPSGGGGEDDAWNATGVEDSGEASWQQGTSMDALVPGGYDDPAAHGAADSARSWGFGAGMDSSGVAEETAAPEPPPGEVEWVRVVSDYAAQGEGEMSIEEGERLNVLRKDPSGWWEGQSEDGSRLGWFPSNFCVRLYELYTIQEGDTPRTETGRTEATGYY